MMKNVRSLLAVSLALTLAACGTTNQSASTPAPGARTPAAEVEGGSAPALVTALSLQPLGARSVNALPDVRSLRKLASDRAEATQDLIVGYRDRESLNALAAHLGASVEGDLPQLRAALLRLPSDLSVTRAALALRLSGAQGVAYAEANDYAAQLDPVQHQSGTLGTLATTGDPDPQAVKQWWVKRVQADQVRGVATGKGVVVGVVDDDFNRQHEDLKAEGKIVTGIDGRSGKAVLTPDSPLTSGTHGTGSAGTIGERLGNGVGGAGVAPDAILMPVRIFDEQGYVGTFQTARALVWAVDHGAQVLNNSWGGGGYTQLLKDAFDYAQSRNVVVVGSAGNDRRDLQNGPGAFTGSISVGATDGADRKTNFSNLGARVDLYAPGDQGFTTYVSTSTDGKLRNDEYGLFNGTSMAGPVVSGAAALLLDRAAQKNLTLTPYQVKQLLANSADNVVKDSTQQNRPIAQGRLNVKKALAALDNAPLPADGGSVAVRVVDLVEGRGLYGSDVILSPLDGQNRGLDYLGRTSRGEVFDRTGKADTADFFGGKAFFYGVDPGRYEVKVAGPSINVYGGSRATILGTLTVKSGAMTELTYTHQADVYEYALDKDGNTVRNNTRENATDLTGVPADVLASGSALLGGAFDSQNFVYAPEVKGPDVDYYALRLAGGKDFKVSVLGRKFGSKASAVLEVLNGSGEVISKSAAAPASSPFDTVVTAKIPRGGTYYVRVSEANKGEGLGYFYGMVPQQ